jgi:WD40 repeat protein
VGAGGFGVVYRAWQPSVGREVAVKMVLPEHANQTDFIRRFEAEAELIARIEHPNIVPLYDYWRDPYGAYLVMRWLSRNLKYVLQQGMIPLPTVATMLDQLCAALGVAHRAGIVHRDVKPENILLDENHNAYLADFGIAYVHIQSQVPDAKNVVTGSLGYMTPEQLREEPVGPETDVYSLGIVLYEMISGQKPFSNDLSITALIDKQLDDPLPMIDLPDPRLSEAINEVIQRATRKDRSERYPDTLSFAAAFRVAIAPGMVSAVSLPGVNPYKGLRAFQEADTPDFYGREMLVNSLVQRIENEHFLAIVGPSGSGKSSVVSAGVIPALRRGALLGSEKWFFVEMVPGTRPFENLETALLRVARSSYWLGEDDQSLYRAIQLSLPTTDETELVLFIDQFEELFTLVEDESVRLRFLRNLIQAITIPDTRLRLIITLRADFLDRPLSYPAFAPILRAASSFVLPLVPDELREAIVQPAERVGLIVDPALIDAILTDVTDQPGILPLVQYALTDLFERREGRVLTLRAYRAHGGVSGALANRAEDLYQSLEGTAQRAVRQIFLRLVTLGESSDDTRRRVERTELSAMNMERETIDRVLDLFGKYRLLSFDHNPATRTPTVEVAHEALLRSWGRLHDWLNQSRDDIRIQRRLMASAGEWLNAARDPSFLANGVRLEQFEAWAANTTLDMTKNEGQYLVASVAQRQAVQQEDRRRRAQEAATARLVVNFRRATIGLASVGVLALLAIIGLANQAATARGQIAEAQSIVDVAQVELDNTYATLTPIPLTLTAVGNDVHHSQTTINQLQLAADANRVLITRGNVETAALLSISALNMAYLPEADSTLRQSIEQVYTLRNLPDYASTIYGVAISSDQHLIAAGGANNTVMVWAMPGGQVVRIFKGHTSTINTVAFSPDGRYLVSGSKDETARLWDIRTGRSVRIFSRRYNPDFSPGHESAINTVAFSPDGRSVLTVSRDQSARLWDIASGTDYLTIAGYNSGFFGGAFSRDGKWIALSSSDKLIRIFDSATGQLKQTLTGHTGPVWSVAFSPDGSELVSGSSDTTARIWNLATGQTRLKLSGHTGDVTNVAYSPDGNSILTASYDGTAREWNTSDGEVRRYFSGHLAAVWAIAYSADGKTMITGSEDGTVRLWNADPFNDPAIFARHGGTIWSVAISPDGRTIASASDDHTIRLWNASTGTLLQKINEQNNAYVVVFSPDGRELLIGSSDNTPRLWDATTGALIYAFKGKTNTDPIYGLAFSPDGKLFLSGANDGAARLWDIAAQKMLYTFKHDGPVNSVAFSHDGKIVATGSYDHTVKLWDVQTGALLLTFKEHSDSVGSVVFSSDDKRVLSASDDTTAKLWETATGKVLQTFTGQTSAIKDAIFSPDGKAIFTASNDGTVWEWDTHTAQRLRIFAGHRNYVTSVAVSPDGKSIFTGSADMTLRRWETNYEDFLENACTRLVRDFTPEDRKRFNIDPANRTCPQFGPTPTLTP